MTLCSKGCGRLAQRRGMCSSHYNTRRERDIAYGRWQSSYVDAEPARRHVLALRAAGMGKRTLSKLSGVSVSVIHVLVNGRPERGTAPSRRIADNNARAILAVPMPDTSRLAAGCRVDITGTTRRLRALVAIGYTQADLAARLGITPANSTALFHAQGRVLASTALKVVDLYDRLSMTSGPSQAARDRARRLKWAPPLAWDDEDIDDPAAKPDLGQRRPVYWDERYRELRHCGYSDLKIIDILGVQPGSMLRQMERYGITPAPELVSLAVSQRYRKKVSA